MNWSSNDDPISRESRRSAIVRRLISHGVRTKLITRLTGVTRSRQATLRRRLMVRGNARRRGPTKSSLELFLGTPKARAEAAALASLFALNDIPVEPKGPYIPKHASFDFSERLCEVYEAYRALFPATEIELEELILLRRALASALDMALSRCRICRCLILVNRFDAASRACAQCEPEQHRAKSGYLVTGPHPRGSSTLSSGARAENRPKLAKDESDPDRER